MSNLINLDELSKRELVHYAPTFSDCYNSSNKSLNLCNFFPNFLFKYNLCIHDSDLKNFVWDENQYNEKLSLAKINSWVNKNCSGNVLYKLFYTTINYDYLKSKHKYYDTRIDKNTYYDLYFEDMDDLVIFKLTYADIIKTKQEIMELSSYIREQLLQKEIKINYVQNIIYNKEDNV